MKWLLSFLKRMRDFFAPYEPKPPVSPIKEWPAYACDFWRHGDPEENNYRADCMAVAKSMGFTAIKVVNPKPFALDDVAAWLVDFHDETGHGLNESQNWWHRCSQEGIPRLVVQLDGRSEAEKAQWRRWMSRYTKDNLQWVEGGQVKETI